MEKSKLAFKSGYTFTAFFAILFAIFVFIPANIYLQLMTGQTITAAWFIMLLWTEFGRITGKSISRQEGMMILLLSGVMAGVAPLSMVFRVYFRNSDTTYLFGFADQIPTWWVPSPESRVQITRSFLHPAWMGPFIIALSFTAIASILNIALGLLGRELFIEAEDLPFPLQQASAQAINTITSRAEKGRTNLIFIFGLVGFFWGFFLYALPFLIQAYIGQIVRFVPIPWIDVSPQLGRYMPGAMLGVATGIGPIAACFVLSPSAIISIIVGSFAAWFFGNWIIVNYNLSLLDWWVPAMSAELIYQRSTLYFWSVPIIGLTFAGGLFPIIHHYDKFLKTFKSLFRPLPEKRKTPEVFSSKITLIPIILCTIIGIMYFVLLSPDFPLWIITPLVLLLPFCMLLINGRMIGETGLTTTILPAQLVYYASGYKGVDVWFVPNIMNSSGVGVLANLKVAQLTQTTAHSYIKMYLISLPIAIAVGYFFVQVFWSLAPIPSGSYPGVAIFWPVQAINTSIWIKGTEMGLFNLIWLVESFILGGAIHFIISLTGIPLSFISIIAGLHTPTPFAVTYIIGLVITIFIRRFVGESWWKNNRWLCSAGLIMGQSVAVIIGISISLIINSIWVLPV